MRSTLSRGALTLALSALIALTGCSNAAKKAAQPAALVRLTNQIEVKRVWSAHLSGETPKLRLGLGIAADGERVFIASHSGLIEAFDRASGKQLWRANVKAPLAGGPAAGEGLVVTGTSKGEVIALGEADGKPRWRVRVNTEILSAPAIGTDLVVVHGVDGKLYGLSAADGTQQWLADQQVPRLSLRGTSRPVLQGELAICGFDNGRVMAVARANGTTAWDVAVGQSRGSTELARLIDIDAPLISDGDDLFAVAYQGRVARLNAANGQTVWGRDLSSYRGLAVDASGVYVSVENGDLVRLNRDTGAEQWRQKALARRQLSAPVVYGGRVVVADVGGAVHFIDAANGQFVARVVLKKRVSAPPVVAGDVLLVFTDNGELAAYRTAPAAIPVAAR